MGIYIDQGEIEMREFYKKKAKISGHHSETLADICVCCGEPVPEGRMICWRCEHQFDGQDENSGDQITGRSGRNSGR